MWSIRRPGRFAMPMPRRGVGGATRSADFPRGFFSIYSAHALHSFNVNFHTHFVATSLQKVIISVFSYNGSNCSGTSTAWDLNGVHLNLQSAWGIMHFQPEALHWTRSWVTSSIVTLASPVIAYV